MRTQIQYQKRHYFNFFYAHHGVAEQDQFMDQIGAFMQFYLKYYEKVSTLAEEPLRAAICHQLAGGSVVAAICDSEISLGLSQYIIYMDFDGEREKTVEINIVGE